MPLSPVAWIGFLAMCLGMFMAVLDIQVVATSLPTIQRALVIPLDKMSWVQTAYLIAEVIAIPLSGLLTRVLTMRWLYENKGAAIEFLTREMKLKPSHAEKGWQYYVENHIWHPDADINVEGMKVVVQIQAEQGTIKPPVPSPAKYIDQSYLREALRGLGK